MLNRLRIVGMNAVGHVGGEDEGARHHLLERSHRLLACRVGPRARVHDAPEDVLEEGGHGALRALAARLLVVEQRDHLHDAVAAAAHLLAALHQSLSSNKYTENQSWSTLNSLKGSRQGLVSLNMLIPIR